MYSNPDVPPLRLNVDFQHFVQVYKTAYNESCEISLTKLIGFMSYAFDCWVLAWESGNYASDINIASLINLLEKDDRPIGTASWKRDVFNLYLDASGITLKEELLFCFMQHFRKEKHLYNEYYRPKNFLFYIAREVKMFLFKKIRSIVAHYKRNNNFTIPCKLDLGYYDYSLDTFYLEQNTLHFNVLLLILEQTPKSQIIQSLGLSKQQYKEIITCLSQNLKQLNK